MRKTDKQMKVKAMLASLAVLASLSITSCGGDEGPGGESSIHFTAKHHSKEIPYTTAYIKFGARTSPGTDPADYDATVTSDAVGHGAFDGLMKGDYYIYGVGYDSAISQAVTGGVPVSIKKGEEKEVTLAITED
jgi:hypothetical protein